MKNTGVSHAVIINRRSGAYIYPPGSDVAIGPYADVPRAQAICAMHLWSAVVQDVYDNMQGSADFAASGYTMACKTSKGESTHDLHCVKGDWQMGMGMPEGFFVAIVSLLCLAFIAGGFAAKFFLNL